MTALNKLGASSPTAVKKMLYGASLFRMLLMGIAESG